MRLTPAHGVVDVAVVPVDVEQGHQLLERCGVTLAGKLDTRGNLVLAVRGPREPRCARGVACRERPCRTRNRQGGLRLTPPLKHFPVASPVAELLHRRTIDGEGVRVHKQRERGRLEHLLHLVLDVRHRDKIRDHSPLRVAQRRQERLTGRQGGLQRSQESGGVVPFAIPGHLWDANGATDGVGLGREIRRRLRCPAEEVHVYRGHPRTLDQSLWDDKPKGERRQQPRQFVRAIVGHARLCLVGVGELRPHCESVVPAGNILRLVPVLFIGHSSPHSNEETGFAKSIAVLHVWISCSISKAAVIVNWKGLSADSVTENVENQPK